MKKKIREKKIAAVFLGSTKTIREEKSEVRKKNTMEKYLNGRELATEQEEQHFNKNIYEN